MEAIIPSSRGVSKFIVFYFKTIILAVLLSSKFNPSASFDRRFSRSCPFRLLISLSDNTIRLLHKTHFFSYPSSLIKRTSSEGLKRRSFSLNDFFNDDSRTGPSSFLLSVIPQSVELLSFSMII